MSATLARTLSSPAHRLLWAAAVVGTALIVLSSWAYVLPSGSHPFLDERPSLANWPVWRIALAAHVAGGIVCLPAGLVLVSPRAVTAWPALHTGLGRLYAALFVVVLFPTGVLLAGFAKGGWLTGPGFFLSAVFGTGALLWSIRLVRQGDVAGHRAWMLRSYAQLASAITFRIVHLVLQLAALPYDPSYAASLWASVLGNAVLAEIIIAQSTRTGGRP
ncbi:MAG: hypothetical protein ACI8PZ_004727 [Myxococcota bacterium]|jgi:hypothetical protein